MVVYFKARANLSYCPAKTPIKIGQKCLENNGKSTLLVHCLYQMSPFNHKRSASSLASPKFYVAKKLAIIRQVLLLTLRLSKPVKHYDVLFEWPKRTRVSLTTKEKKDLAINFLSLPLTRTCDHPHPNTFPQNFISIFISELFKFSGLRENVLTLLYCYVIKFA